MHYSVYIRLTFRASFLATVTSSSAYCSVPKVLVVDNAELTLYRSNSTLEFELAAGSTANNINVTVAAEINAYGLGTPFKLAGSTFATVVGLPSGSVAPATVPAPL